MAFDIVEASPKLIGAAGGRWEISNRGTSLAYYGGPNVSSTTYEGTIPSGSTITLPKGAWFVSAGQSSLFSVPATVAAPVAPVAATRTQRAVRQGEVSEGTSLEPAPEFTSEASAFATSTEIPSTSAAVLNPKAPWALEGADMISNGSGFAAPLRPTQEGERVLSIQFPYQVMFDFDGEEFQIVLTGAAAEWRFRLWANDAPSAYKTETSGKKFVKVKFASRARRRIVIENDAGTYFGGIVRKNTDTISPPSEVAPTKIAWLWDSYGIGSGVRTGTTSTASAQGCVYTATRALGFSHLRNYSLAGTGFLNEGSKAGNYLQRAKDVVAYAPNVVVVGGSINDSAFTATEMEAQVAKVIGTLQGIPNVTIIVFGPIPMSNTARTTNETNANAVKAAALAAGANYVDSYGQEWIYGTGKVGTTKGDGNADFYSSELVANHPSLAGHSPYLGARFATAIAPILETAI